jgi:hypothetical protein
MKRPAVTAMIDVVSMLIDVWLTSDGEMAGEMMT